MRKKFGIKLKRILTAIFVIGIALTSLPSSLFVTEVHALSNVSGDRIIEVAQS